MAYGSRNQYVDRIAMEVAPSKLPSIVAARGSSRLAVVLDTIQEDDDREAVVQSPRVAPPPPSSSSSHNRRGMEAVTDTPMHCVAAFVGPAAMAKTGCLKVRA